MQTKTLFAIGQNKFKIISNLYIKAQYRQDLAHEIGKFKEW